MKTTINIPDLLDEAPAPEGEAEGAESFATSLIKSASSLIGFVEEIAILTRTDDYWVGGAADSYTSHARRFAREHEEHGPTLKRVANGVDVFAEQLRTLMRAHGALNDDIAAYNNACYELLRNVRQADDTQATVMRGRADSLAARRTVLVSETADLQRRVTENEQLLIELLESADTNAEAAAKTGGISSLALAAIDGMPAASEGPEAMASWWSGLSEAEQDALIAAYPGRLGSADGLPARVRNESNRLLLDTDLAELGEKEARGILAPEERKQLENARATAEALKLADDYKMPGTEEQPGGLLWLYDPTAYGGDGRVAVAIGDLDTAEDVSIQVPGIRTTMKDVAGYTQQAADLYESARFNGDGSGVATMFWLGYDTPNTNPFDDLWGTLGEGRAKEGGELLADAVSGLRASRPDDRAHLSVIGHSYGSTTTSYAATSFDLQADDVALLGSPGAGPADHASDFSVGADHVYDGRNSRDAVAFLGDEGWARKDWVEAGLGVDPSSRDFDAKRFEAESVERGDSRNFDDHGRYYDRNSESLYNLGRIVDGQTDDINRADHSYDPWWRAAVDPEKDRVPSSGVPGKSLTGSEGEG